MGLQGGASAAVRSVEPMVINDGLGRATAVKVASRRRRWPKANLYSSRLPNHPHTENRQRRYGARCGRAFPGRKGWNGGNVTKSRHIKGAQSLYRRWRILQAFFVRSLPHSGSHLSPMRSRSDLLRGHLRTGGPARAAERGSAALSGNSAWSRHARGAEPALSRPTAMRDGSWSLRSARRTLRAPGQHGIDRSASQRNRNR